MIAVSELEKVYDALAEGIDQATPAKSELFLTKLALLLANEIGDSAVVARAIDTALRDM